MKDRYIPTIEGLIEERHPVADKFAPRILDECLQADSIRDWPNSIFVPFPLMEVIRDADPNDDDDEPLSLDAGAVPPEALLLRLVVGVREKKESHPQWFKDWRGVIQNLATFLWAHVQDLSIGNNLITMSNNPTWVRHSVRCSHELLVFLEGLGEEDSSSSDDEPGGKFDIVPRGERRLREDIANAPSRQGASLREGAGDRAPQGRRPDLQDSSNNSDSEGGEHEPREAARRRQATDLPPPPRGAPQPLDAEPTYLPDGIDELARRLLQGILASSKAMEKAGSSLHEFAIVNKNNIEKREEKKKATSRWLPSAVFLFRALSAEDGWRTTGLPELTDFAIQITEMKIFQATQLIRDKAKEEGWPGGILKAGISDFLKRGFMAEDIQIAPSGFSILFFHPSGYTEIDGDDFGLQQSREIFGDGEMPEEVVRAFSKRQIFVPENTYQAADQIKTAVKFLECLCGDRTIATSGYHRGLRVMEENRRIFDSETSRNKIFLLNYLYMLDRVFQAFCKELRPFESAPDPIQDARAVIGERWMEILIDEPIRPWVIQGIRPAFAPPLVLQGRTPLDGVMDLNGAGRNRGGQGAGDGAAAGGGAGGAGAPRRGGAGRAAPAYGDTPNWHRELPVGDCVPDWRLPSGKRLADFFGTSPGRFKT